MLIGEVNFSGLASGLDTRAMIDAILQSERLPLERLQVKQQQLSARKAAFGDLQAKISGLESSLRELSSVRTFRGRATTVSDQTVLRASAGNSAEMGLFSIEVFDLAAAHRVKSDGVVASDQGLLADGTITIQSGDNDQITIDVSAADGNNTLQAVRDAINAEDAGVQASIIFDGSDYRMIVRSEETGLDNALTITDTTDLNLDAAGNEVQAAADASLEVDGIAVTSSSNKVSQVIPGVTLDLLSKTEGTPITVEIAQDYDTIIEAVQELTSKYNEVVDYFNQQFDRDNPGALDGDSTARRIQSKLQSMVTGGLEGIPLGQIRSLSAVGIDFDGKTGRMSLDTAELRDLLESNFDEVGDLFLPSGSSTHAKIDYYSSSTDTVPGDYTVTVSQAAEQATVAGSTAIDAGGLGRDETLTVTVGSDSVDVALTTGQTLADVVDTINAALRDNDIDATARDDGGLLRITTSDYGSEASISVVSDQVDPGDGTGSGFGTTATTDDGQDVAGTIDGVAGTGAGQLLTAAEGGDYEGLTIRVRATASDITATGGDFGTMSYSRGLMKTLTAELQSMTRLGEGPINLASEALTSTLKRLSDDIDRFEERMALREATLVRTFAEAERAISALQSQQSAFGAGII